MQALAGKTALVSDSNSRIGKVVAQQRQVGGVLLDVAVEACLVGETMTRRRSPGVLGARVT